MTDSSEPCPAGTGAQQPRPRSHRRRLYRLCLRCLRIGVRTGYAVLALIGYLLLHLAYVGAPEFLKEPVLNQVRAQGLELESGRIRFLPLRGIVAEQVNVHWTGEADRRPLLVREVSLRFDWRPLLSLSPPRLIGVSFTGGSAAQAVEGAEGMPTALLRMEDLAGELDFSAGDLWRLRWITAQVNGLRLEAMGSVSDAQLLRPRQRPETRPTGLRSPFLARALGHLERMSFEEPPRMEMQFFVHGRDLRQSVLQIRIGAGGGRGPAGEFDDLRLRLDVQPSRSLADRSHGVVHLDSAAVRSRWGALDALQFRAEAEFVPTNALPDRVRWSLNADSLSQEFGRLKRLRVEADTDLAAQDVPPVLPEGLDPARKPGRREPPPDARIVTQLECSAFEFRNRWVTVSNLTLSLQARSTPGEWIPRSADWCLRAEEAVSDEARLTLLDLCGSALPVAFERQPAVTGFWARIAPWRVHARLAATQVQTRAMASAERLHLLADWNEGRLRLGEFEATIPAGSIVGSGSIQASNGEAGLELRGSLAPRLLEPLLPPGAGPLMSRVELHESSSVGFDLSVRARIPATAEFSPELVRNLLPTLHARGVLQSTNLALGDLAVQELRVPFEWTPQEVRVEDMRLFRPPDEVRITADAGWRSGTWHARVEGQANPLDLVPWVRTPGLDRQRTLIQLDGPARVSGELWGDWNDPQRTGVTLQVALTNASYRREPITELRTALSYTNQQMVFTGTELLQGTNRARAQVLRYDIPAGLLHVTNGFSTLDVASLARAIGPMTARTLAPYQFTEPPSVRIQGSIPVIENVQGDVFFEASVPRLQWWYFEFERLLATVRWAGDQIVITNVAGAFCGGVVSAAVTVDVSDRQATSFAFNASFADVDLHRLVSDLSTQTNRLEGQLSGEVTVVEGHAQESRPWEGFGNAQLRNGYLWDLPLFGMFSPAFESISPGLGSARFREGNALFALTNRSVDLRRVELVSSAMRLQLEGLVGFDGSLRLVLEAEPLRDLPLVGPLVNLVLSPFTKLMEYDVTGTLERPEAELRHVPSFLRAPLQPFRTLKSVFQGSPGPGTRKPPAEAPSP